MAGMGDLKTFDVFRFRRTKGNLDGTMCYFVAKGQDQVERRNRMIASRSGGRFGRINQRPTSIGLLACCALDGGDVRT